MTDAIDFARPDAWARLDTRLLSVAEPRLTPGRGHVECPPEWRWRVTLRDFDLWFAVRGRGTLILGHERMRFPIAAGTIFVLRPGDVVAAEQDPADPLTVTYAHFDFIDATTRRPIDVPPSLLTHRAVPLADPATLDALMLRMVRLDPSVVALADQEAALLLRQVLLHVYRQDAVNRGPHAIVRDARLDRLAATIATSPHRRVTLEEAASQTGLSADYFSRRFRDQFGMPFRSWQVQIRLQRARYLLEETDLGVSEIAAALGYDDVYLFSRQFRARMGCAPSSVRYQTTGSVQRDTG